MGMHPGKTVYHQIENLAAKPISLRVFVVVLSALSGPVEIFHWLDDDLHFLEELLNLTIK